MPPLLYSIPTMEEIKNIKPENLICVKTIKSVLNESLSCISYLNKSRDQIFFRINSRDNFISHQQRIVNSHRGFIDNFIEFIRMYYSNADGKQDDTFTERFKAFITILIELRDQYNPYYTGDEKND